MQTNRTSRFIPIGMTVVTVTLYAVLHSADLNSLKSYAAVFCDGFTLSGALLLLVGCITRGISGGMFTGITYLLSRVGKYLIPGAGLAEKESYRDYALRKNKEASNAPNLFLWVGLANLLCVAICLIMYYNV